MSLPGLVLPRRQGSHHRHQCERQTLRNDHRDVVHRGNKDHLQDCYALGKEEWETTERDRETDQSC
jgi:hypothetical protein